MTPLEAPALPPRPASNSLLPDAVARLVSAATVEATVAAELAVETEAALVEPELAAEAELEVLNRLDSEGAWLLLILPIDIMTSTGFAASRIYRPSLEGLERYGAGHYCCPAALMPTGAAEGSLKIATLSPKGYVNWKFPPAATAMYCSPSIW